MLFRSQCQNVSPIPGLSPSLGFTLGVTAAPAMAQPENSRSASAHPASAPGGPDAWNAEVPWNGQLAMARSTPAEQSAAAEAWRCRRRQLLRWGLVSLGGLLLPAGQRGAAWAAPTAGSGCQPHPHGSPAGPPLPTRNSPQIPQIGRAHV